MKNNLEHSTDARRQSHVENVLQIQNFRGFNALEIDQLSGINLIAGKKQFWQDQLTGSSFSAVWRRKRATGCKCQCHSRHRKRWRFGEGFSSGSSSSSILIWNSPLKLKGEYKSHGQFALEIASEQQPTTEITLDSTDGSSATNLFDERSLIFQYSDPSDQKIKSHIRFKGQKLEVQQPAINVPFIAAILLSRGRNIHEDAKRLGMLKKKKQGDLLLKALQVVEPKLQSIEDSFASGTPMIWGDIGLSELVPLPAMGEGMTQPSSAGFGHSYRTERRRFGR